MDSDGIGDNHDEDDDGDGVINAEDEFPDDPNEWSDIDGDMVGDNSDEDRDGDGHNNDVDPFPDDPTKFEGSDDATGPGDGISDDMLPENLEGPAADDEEVE